MNIDAKRKALAGNLVAPHKGGAQGVSVITGLPLPPSQLEELARQLKKRCGCGGTTRNGVIEIQGDHRDLLVAELTRLGYPAKRSGG